MANYSVAKAANKTLSATTVDRVAITGPWPAVEVVNRSLSDVLWVVTAAPGTIPADPTAAADDAEPILPGERVVVRTFVPSNDTKYVKLIGNANPYSVVGTVVRG